MNQGGGSFQMPLQRRIIAHQEEEYRGTVPIQKQKCV